MLFARGEEKNMAQNYQYQAEFEQAYKAATNNGTGDEWEYLGEFYQYGWGCTPDLNEAYKCYEKAAHLDSGKGCFSLGYFLFYGWGCKQDLELADYWMRQSRSLGYSMANLYFWPGWGKGLMMNDVGVISDFCQMAYYNDPSISSCIDNLDRVTFQLTDANGDPSADYLTHIRIAIILSEYHPSTYMAPSERNFYGHTIKLGNLAESMYYKEKSLMAYFLIPLNSEVYWDDQNTLQRIYSNYARALQFAYGEYYDIFCATEMKDSHGQTLAPVMIEIKRKNSN